MHDTVRVAVSSLSICTRLSTGCACHDDPGAQVGVSPRPVIEAHSQGDFYTTEGIMYLQYDSQWGM